MGSKPSIGQPRFRAADVIAASPTPVKQSDTKILLGKVQQPLDGMSLKKTPAPVAMTPPSAKVAIPGVFDVWRLKPTPFWSFLSNRLGPPGTPPVTSEVKWKVSLGAEILSSPAIGVEGNLYVGADDRYLSALNPDGTVRWKFETSGVVRSSPAAALDGTVYVGSDDGHLYALNSDGTLKWKVDVPGGGDQSPAVGPNGDVYLSSSAGYLYAFGPQGDLKWKSKAGDEGYTSTAAIGPDATLCVSTADQWLYALRPDGTERWRFKLRDSSYTSPAIAKDGTVYVGTCNMISMR